MTTARILRRAAAAAGLALLVASPGPVGAANRNGITPLTPQLDRKVAVGQAVVFRMRVHGSGDVFVHVCKSPKKSKRDGTICRTAAIGHATRHNGVFSYTQRFYDYPSFWLNARGTYYWQAYRVLCGKVKRTDCRQEGPVTRFRVR